eukprot:CAMPEP_0114609100 /NCGR_PEP_ID=MMETSP0168-20121206/2916_1 /TAXON_ID=95228 ORGANISM="Vannella sp., Strain DIVA3 517/6/12" /NCGR_SAMPLE_ID=MMETSP0168 /ASSEMBLY_ACC=CAM_ASM_000044 /LENGTH=173 /DNA_ID=CAMNT_0001820011 /DNA_START=38 /DNA_END=559 /DNA_ORIENTATION=-
MAKFFALALLVVFAGVAAAQFFGDPGDFPGNTLDVANFPQNAGGEHFPPIGAPDTLFFTGQNAGAGVGNTFTTGLTGGLTGAYPGQVSNTGVDPVRGIVLTNLASQGSSSSSVTGRSGHGAASSNGFGIAETKYPDRLNVHTTDFITTDLDSSSANVLYPTAVAFVAALALLF